MDEKKGYILNSKVVVDQRNKKIKKIIIGKVCC